MGRCEGECQIGLGCCAGKKSGGRVTSVIEKIIASNAPKITGILVLIAEHEVHHALSPEAGNRPEKAGFAQMDLIAFAIVGRAITPTGAKSAELQPIAFMRVLSPQTSHRTSLIDSVCSIAGIFIDNLPPGYVSACVSGTRYSVAAISSAQQPQWLLAAHHDVDRSRLFDAPAASQLLRAGVGISIRSSTRPAPYLGSALGLRILDKSASPTGLTWI